MNHERWKLICSRYRDGDLNPAERTLFEEHLEKCEECREAIEIDTLLGESLKAVMEDAYPPDFEKRTMAVIQNSEDEKERWFERVWIWLRAGEFRVPVPVAAAAALALFLLGALATQIVIPEVQKELMRRAQVESAPGDLEWVETDIAGREAISLLRRARTLLLALITAEPDAGGRYHLEAEGALSRDLIQEVRMLGSEAEMDDDREIVGLVRDLELILLDLSTWQGEVDAERMRLLQDGINDRSLIYRCSTYESLSGGN